MKILSIENSILKYFNLRRILLLNNTSLKEEIRKFVIQYINILCLIV